MREILFKGKRKENGKWVEGYYQQRYDAFENIQHLIFWAKSSTVWEYAEVVPETVCQYTGLEDKNGRKIFEGDIAKLIIEYVGGATREHICRVNFDEYGATFKEIRNENNVFPYGEDVGKNDIEIIDNIFDNHELMRG